MALRFLAEDPWERLAALREAMPNICLQMLLRGRNTVGYTPYPTEVTDAFVAEAARTGIDIFRIFDALNDVDQMRPAIDAVRATGTAVAEVALCYTGDLTDPDERLYTLDYYLRLAEQIVEAGAHVLAIKDMAGLLRAAGGRARLVTALRERFDLPVHLHTHDTAGGQLGHAAGGDRRRGRRRRRRERLDGGHDQPAAAVGARRRHRRTPSARPAWTCRPSCDLEPYWEAVRRLYAPVRVGPALPHRPRLHPRDPGRPAVQPAPAGHRARARRAVRGRSRTCTPPPTGILGNLVKVTPSLQGRRRPRAARWSARAPTPRTSRPTPRQYDIPDSVIGFLRGELGDPPGGWPEPFRTKALEGRTARPRRRPS